jgi:hypothetical protein
MIVKEEWKEVLDILRNENKWRITKLPDGQIDPYGSTSIHGVVAKVIVGSHTILLKGGPHLRASFFFFLLVGTCH